METTLEQVKVDAFCAGPFGDLTTRQYEVLRQIAARNPGYRVCALRLPEHDGSSRGSGATRIEVWHPDSQLDPVGLVGKKDVQVYDGRDQTKRLCRAIAHQVYRFFGWEFPR